MKGKLLGKTFKTCMYQIVVTSCIRIAEFYDVFLYQTVYVTFVILILTYFTFLPKHYM